MPGLSVWLNETDSMEGCIVGVISSAESDSSVEGDEVLPNRDGLVVGLACIG